VLPETDAAGGRVVAERIRQKIERARSRAAEASSRAPAGAQSEPAAAVTASFGCATLGPARFATAVELLAAAEAALGQATRAGCNRVESDAQIGAIGLLASATRNAS
jgi:PleD family two-component response regulator